MKNQFKKASTPLDDVFILERFIHSDQRGVFTKTFNLNMFKELDLGEALEIKESLCSVSKKNVLRGMHYQQYPYGAAKIVSVVKGRILDVIVGIGGNFNTKNHGKIFSVELSDTNAKSLYVPDGYAHGFLVLSEEAIVVYHQTNHFNAAADKGINFNSFGFQWPVAKPIVSKKDIELPGLNEF
jgi:dTDP-4-dehydrorhamnose 3,5-epimerase